MSQINGAWEDLEELFVEALGEHVVPGYSKKSSKKKSKGRYLYDVHKILGFSDPLPPCPQIHATSLTKLYYYVCF